jgi:hypothetical protein
MVRPGPSTATVAIANWVTGDMSKSTGVELNAE